MNIQVARDAEGYLVNPDDWTDDIAIELAKEESIDLTESHWQILRFIRKYYSEHNVIPDIRHVDDYLATENEIDKKEAIFGVRVTLVESPGIIFRSPCFSVCNPSIG